MENNDCVRKLIATSRLGDSSVGGGQVSKRSIKVELSNSNARAVLIGWLSVRSGSAK